MGTTMHSGMDIRPLRPLAGDVRSKWRWFVALGVTRIAGGIAEIFLAFNVRTWGGFVFWSLSGLLYGAAGVLAFYNPVRAAIRRGVVRPVSRQGANMTRTSIFASLLLTSVVSVAHGKECRGVSFPEHVQVDGSDLTLNGLGLRKATFLKVNVYVAALYVAQPSRDPMALVESSGPDELILHFVRNVGADDLTKAWNEGFARNSKDQVVALQERIAKLNGWMADVKSGQRLTFIRRPGAGIQVDANGTVKGTIEGDDFARAFFAIWLGATPPNPELKSGLLGGVCE